MTAPGISAPGRVVEEQHEDSHLPATPWQVVVWDDPVNLMSYVVWVFRKLFGYSEHKATLLMLDVHEEGRAVVSSGLLETAEIDCYRLHHHGLWATLEKA